MKLIDLNRLPDRPAPWSEGEKIPWDEPGFSRRMLREHLSQDHDLASRRTATIERHAEFLHRLLPPSGARVLDLGCGPGFYCHRLAERGHECVGIDFSPASIAYAQSAAAADALPIRYDLEDVRAAEFGSGFDLVLLLYGEFNVFRKDDVEDVVRRARAALEPGGLLVLELQRFDGVKRRGEADPTWRHEESGLFLDSPHLCLSQSFWDEVSATETTRWIVVDVNSEEVHLHAATTQAWTEVQVRELLTTCGFEHVSVRPSLDADSDVEDEELWVLVASCGP